MKKPAHKIDAIKILRDMPIHIVEAISNYGFPIQKIQANVTLSEAKDFIVAVMELGKAEAETATNQSVINELKEQVARLNNEYDTLYSSKLSLESQYWALRDSLYNILNK